VFIEKCPIKIDLEAKKNKTAIILDEQTISYGQLNAKIDEAVIYLQGAGVQRGHRVALIARNNLQTVIAFFALARLGAACCALSTRLPHDALPTKIKELAADFFLDTLTSIVSVTGSSNTDITKGLVFSIMYTSGSSSAPKMAAHSIDNFLYSALGSNEALALSDTDSWLLSLPLFHVGGIAILFRIFLSAGSVVITELPFLDSLYQFPVTHVSMVPTQLYRLVQNKPQSIPSSIKSILVGGAPIGLDLFEKISHLGINILPTYGMTEMSSQVTMAHPKDSSSGVALPYREIRISEEGEILVRGKTLFLGYLQNKTNLHCPLNDTWFATKDLGKIDENGNLRVLGRKDNMFISGGENIHPETIERELLTLPGIIQAFVIAIEDKEFGHRPVAFIDQDQQKIKTLDEIKEHLSLKLPKYYCPIKIYNIPNTLLKDMKVSRASLKFWLATTQA